MRPMGLSPRWAVGTTLLLALSSMMVGQGAVSTAPNDPAAVLRRGLEALSPTQREAFWATLRARRAEAATMRTTSIGGSGTRASATEPAQARPGGNPAAADVVSHRGHRRRRAQQAQLVNNTLTARLVIYHDIAAIPAGSGARANFETSFAHDVAALAGSMPYQRVRVLDLRAGEGQRPLLAVRFAILPDASGTAFPVQALRVALASSPLLLPNLGVYTAGSLTQANLVGSPVSVGQCLGLPLPPSMLRTGPSTRNVTRITLEVDQGSDLSILAGYVAKILIEERIGFGVDLMVKPASAGAIERLARGGQADVNMAAITEAAVDVQQYNRLVQQEDLVVDLGPTGFSVQGGWFTRAVANTSRLSAAAGMCVDPNYHLTYEKPAAMQALGLLAARDVESARQLPDGSYVCDRTKGAGRGFCPPGSGGKYFSRACDAQGYALSSPDPANPRPCRALLVQHPGIDAAVNEQLVNSARSTSCPPPSLLILSSAPPHVPDTARACGCGAQIWQTARGWSSG
jgi:hypothetical protein